MTAHPTTTVVVRTDDLHHLRRALEVTLVAFDESDPAFRMAVELLADLAQRGVASPIPTLPWW